VLKKPLPKELDVKIVQGPTCYILIISYETNDAFDFINSLTEFGALHKGEAEKTMLLYLRNTFDIQHMKKYIESYNDT
jgi:hypothetical protein